ncbi:MAG TPA: hypothetical protein VFA59_12005 [Vicinamibacterales bacterium]|nr:hypothetical protein [Vicinamibacterales bacterium]
MDDTRALLRHTVATLAYRGGKAIRHAPPTFATYRCAETARTPIAILAHIGDLFDWALSIAKGQQAWSESTPASWDAEVARFFATLQRFDDYLASDAVLAETPEKLFQGPIADALTHVGQLTLLRRLASAPIKAENYHKAEIRAGRVGADQAAPKREF